MYFVRHNVYWALDVCLHLIPLSLDIAAHNIIMDPQTLQVKALIDWGYTGYFPPGMERWPRTLELLTGSVSIT